MNKNKKYIKMSEEDISEINIIYQINKENKEDIKIFGNKFVKNNQNICKMIIDNKEYEICEKYNIKNYNKNKLEIKLKGIDNINNMSNMFRQCSSLLSLPDIYKWNTINVTDISYMFYRCSSLSSLPDISKWNTNNVKNISWMFYGCSSLSSLPDISKWNINNVKNMSFMFFGCSSLSSLPDISKWNINNVNNMHNIPDISKWNINNEYA